MTPLIGAAERTRVAVVRYFVDRYKPSENDGPDRIITKEQKIDALELLGASFANDKDNYCLELAYHYLHRAMKLRYSSEMRYPKGHRQVLRFKFVTSPCVSTR